MHGLRYIIIEREKSALGNKIMEQVKKKENEEKIFCFFFLNNIIHNFVGGITL